MKHCLALRHVAFEDLGSFDPVLRGAGYDIAMAEAGYDDISRLDPLAADLMVVLGGPIGVYDAADYPFLNDEIDLIRARLSAGRPIIGICLGAQLIAHVLGARVHPNPAGREIGWSPLSLTAAGRDSPLAELGDAPVLHWHGDTFDLPAGARWLASTAVTPHQAFLHGATALGLQFHVEATARGLERWFIGHTVEIAQAGLSVPALRADTFRHAPGLEDRAGRLLETFLSGL